MLTLLFSVNGYSDVDDRGYKCFEEIIGNLVVEPNSNVVWYRKMSVYTPLVHGGNILSVGKGNIPEVRKCKDVYLEIVPIEGYELGVDSRKNIISFSITSPIVAEKRVKNKITSRYRIGKLNAPTYRDVRSTRYFHKLPKNTPEVHVNVDPNSASTPHLKSHLFYDEIKNSEIKSYGLRSVEKQITKSKRNNKYSDEAVVNSKIQNPSILTSNNCWLIHSEAKKYYGKVRRAPSIFTYEVEKNLQLYSLLRDDNHVTHNGTKCQKPAYFESQRVKNIREDELDLPTDKIPSDFKLYDFPNYKYVVQWDNTLPVGLDFDVFSFSPYTLDIVYQNGFRRNKQEEKNLSGDLVYRRFVREGSSIRSSRIKKVIEKNITSKCDSHFEGWEHSPKISKYGDVLFFLAQLKSGEDASETNLYSVPISKLLSENYSCHKHVKNLTAKFDFDFPIRHYRISDDQKILTIVFEKRGSSVVKFFRLHPRDGTIIQIMPIELTWDGYIHDIVSTDKHAQFGKPDTYYLLASKLNKQKSIYVCRLIGAVFNCDQNDHKSVDLLTLENLLKKNNYEFEGNVIVEKIEVESSHGQPNIHTFILRPEKSKRNGKAIISIHGGPNDAWNGRFSRREYLLAKQGYTIFLPNPTGSTGYGFEYAASSAKNWGTKIYHDIQDVIDYVSDLKNVSDTKEFPKIIVKGFSFGGYMVNWIQTRPELIKRKTLSSVFAFVALNPGYDLTEFASSTDQLWFPKHELGCAGEDCKKMDECTILHNPACYSGNLGHESFPAIPTYFVVSDFDQRIPKCANIPSMLEDYVKAEIPFNIRVPFAKHGLGFEKDHNTGVKIHKWINRLEELQKEANNNPTYLKKHIDCNSNSFSEFQNCSFDTATLRSDINKFLRCTR